jgi:hypothetical protein
MDATALATEDVRFWVQRLTLAAAMEFERMAKGLRG